MKKQKILAKTIKRARHMGIVSVCYILYYGEGLEGEKGLSVDAL